MDNDIMLSNMDKLNIIYMTASTSEKFRALLLKHKPKEYGSTELASANACIEMKKKRLSQYYSNHGANMQEFRFDQLSAEQQYEQAKGYCTELLHVAYDYLVTGAVNSYKDFDHIMKTSSNYPNELTKARQELEKNRAKVKGGEFIDSLDKNQAVQNFHNQAREVERVEGHEKNIEHRAKTAVQTLTCYLIVLNLLSKGDLKTAIIIKNQKAIDDITKTLDALGLVFTVAGSGYLLLKAMATGARVNYTAYKAVKLAISRISTTTGLTSAALKGDWVAAITEVMPIPHVMAPALARMFNKKILKELKDPKGSQIRKTSDVSIAIAENVEDNVRGAAIDRIRGIFTEDDIIKWIQEVEKEFMPLLEEKPVIIIEDK